MLSELERKEGAENKIKGNIKNKPLEVNEKIVIHLTNQDEEQQDVEWSVARYYRKYGRVKDLLCMKHIIKEKEFKFWSDWLSMGSRYEELNK